MEELFKQLIEKAPWVSYVLMGLGSAVVVFTAIAPLTPTKKDDELLEKSWFKKVADVLMGFSLFHNKK